MDEERYLTTQEAARILRVHENSIRKWLKEGRLPGVRLGNRWRISLPAIDRMMEEAARARLSSGEGRDD